LGVQVLWPAPFFYGGVAKWLNAADCKSAPSGFGGSNPSPSIYIFLKNGYTTSTPLLIYWAIAKR
jgi:hypothetical protein